MKKIKLLLNSVIGTSALALPILSVVACGNTEPEEKGADIKPFINVYKKLEFSYNGNKADTYAKDVNLADIKVKGYDVKEFQIIIKSVKAVPYLSSTIYVEYEIKDLKTNAKSSELIFTIGGFKAEEVSDK
ncbi:hypothetical protein ACNQ2O_02030 [Mycoplasma sp. AA7A]|uniref:hypothetical protein n=1 Tax=unclassified Mycoplasma TaxID=2683645 RepID=UPI003A8C4F72